METITSRGGKGEGGGGERRHHFTVHGLCYIIHVSPNSLQHVAVL